MRRWWWLGFWTQDYQDPPGASMMLSMIWINWPPQPSHRQERLQEAAKSQVRRMCTLKRKKVGLNLPAWVIEEYQKRPKIEMAKLLMDCNFDKARCLGPTIVYTIQSNLYYGSPHATHPSSSQRPCTMTGEVRLRVGDDCQTELFQEHHCGIPVGEREGNERWVEMEPALWLKVVSEIMPQMGNSKTLYAYVSCIYI